MKPPRSPPRIPTRMLATQPWGPPRSTTAPDSAPAKKPTTIQPTTPISGTRRSSCLPGPSRAHSDDTQVGDRLGPGGVVVEAFLTHGPLRLSPPSRRASTDPTDRYDIFRLGRVLEARERV